MLSKVVYVPWLHMHQPLVWYRNRLMSNLEMMMLSKDSGIVNNSMLIARAYKNPAKYVKYLKRKGLNPKIMLDFSGILLESLKELTKKFKKMKVSRERIGDIIKLYKEILKKYPSSLEFAGTAYSHCYFPVTPETDWELQITEWRNLFKKLFGKRALERVKGFWLPEMGIPGDEDKLAELIKILKDFGYEWIILSTDAVEGERKMSYEQRISLTSQPHVLSVKGEEITTILKVKYDFLDQQSGCDANCVYKKCLEAAKVFKGKKPALIVPATDGENGNVMLNEFFPKTYVPFFKKRVKKKISSLTITEFLQKYYEKEKITSRIKIKKYGGSWVGEHKQWKEGIIRETVNKKIEEMSRRFHRIKPEKLRKNLENTYENAKRMLLISETSCYTYWGTEFWFSQGEKTIKILEKLLKKLVK